MTPRNSRPSLSVSSIMARLKEVGTAQNRKVYARHGVVEDSFGVSFAEIRKLAKQVGTAHDIGMALWATANHDARVLACQVMDPVACSLEQMEEMVGSVDNYVVSDQLAALVARRPDAAARAEAWSRDEAEFVAATAWTCVSVLALRPEGPDDNWFAGWLARAEADIHDAPNRVRHAMNQAVIAIGCRNEPLREAALAVADRIGPVQVDHGETGCKTPAARPYIERTWQRKRR